MVNQELSNQEVLEKMARLCSKSEQCSGDIRKKIVSAGINEEDADEIIEKLKAEKYLDDERYAASYVADKFKFNKWGRVKMKYYLRMKGLSDETIQKGLDTIDEDIYREVLVKTMKERAKKLKKKNKFEMMGQVIRFTQNRGFEPEKIHRYLNEALGY